MTLAQAETLASSYSGHVTSINSPEEQEFIDRTFGFANFWIGLNDRKTEGTHVWSNGDLETYRNWASSQQNNNSSLNGVYFSTGGDETGGMWRYVSEMTSFKALIEIVNPTNDADADGLYRHVGSVSIRCLQRL